MILTFLRNLFDSMSERKDEFGYLVHDGSPAYIAGIQPFFDFILSINDIRLNQDPNSLMHVLKDSQTTTFNLYLYNIKTNLYRTVCVRKNSEWGGESVLGVNVKYTNISDAESNVWHVLQVYYGSPADIAGLRPSTDYIIGSDCVFGEENDFYDLLFSNQNQPVKLTVYNSETDATREVIVVPNCNWKAEGCSNDSKSLLGADIGYGLLHRIPVPSETVSNPPFVQKLAPNPQASVTFTTSTTTPTAIQPTTIETCLPPVQPDAPCVQPYYGNSYSYASPVYSNPYESQIPQDYYPSQYTVDPSSYIQSSYSQYPSEPPYNPIHDPNKQSYTTNN